MYGIYEQIVILQIITIPKAFLTPNYSYIYTFL